MKKILPIILLISGCEGRVEIKPLKQKEKIVVAPSKPQEKKPISKPKSKTEPPKVVLPKRPFLPTTPTTKIAQTGTPTTKSSEPKQVLESKPTLEPEQLPESKSILPPETETIEKPTPPEEAETTVEAHSSGLITNTFIDTDMKDVLKDIAFQAGEEIILDDTVRGIVSAEFKECSFEEALEKILVQGGYAYKKIKDYYLIGYPDPKNPTFRHLADVETIKLDYLEAADCVKLLPDTFSQYIKADKETNSLIVTAPSQTIQTIKGHINKLDKKPGCVKIELLVVEMFSETRKTLGMEWGYKGEKLKELSDILPLTTFNTDNKNVLLQIKGLIEEGKVKIRANPKVTTLDGKPASISIGKEEYYLSPASIYQPYASFNTIKSGIILKVTPFITKEDGIRLEIEPEVSDVTEIGQEGLPVISRRTAKTSVIIKDNETQVLGGLIAESKQERKSKLPILGSIPILGRLFSINSKKNYETELVIFITPSVVKP